MDLGGLLRSFRERGIRLRADGDALTVVPRSKLTDEDRQAIRDNKLLLLDHLKMLEVVARNVTPDSRHPLISDVIRAKIEAIEPEARAKGWPAELLWNAWFWDYPRGLAAVLDADDEIADVTAEFIEIVKMKREVLRFRRTNS
jgi:hypothetical protein